MKQIKQKIMTVGLAAMMALPGYSAEKVETKPVESEKAPIVQLNKGYNDISVGVNGEGTSLTRGITNVDVDFAGLNVSYRGLNEMTDGNTDTYFGIHRIGLGLTEFKAAFQPTARVLTTAEGVIDKKFGFETNKIANLYDGNNKVLELFDAEYGYAGLVSDGSNHTAYALTGHNLNPLAEMTGLSALSDAVVETAISKNFGEYETPTFLEVKVMKPIGENGYGFVQWDNTKVDSSSTYVGFGWKF